MLLRTIKNSLKKQIIEAEERGIIILDEKLKDMVLKAEALGYWGSCPQDVIEGFIKEVNMEEENPSISITEVDTEVVYPEVRDTSKWSIKLKNFLKK